MHERALKYAGRLRAMDGVRWPKIVGEALLEIRGSWVDYVQAQITKYSLRDVWEGEGWEERCWKKKVRECVRAEARRQWQEEVESRTDLGQYKNRQRELGRADYLKGFSKGDEIRAEIKRRYEW